MAPTRPSGTGKRGRGRPKKVVAQPAVHPGNGGPKQAVSKQKGGGRRSSGNSKGTASQSKAHTTEASRRSHRLRPQGPEANSTDELAVGKAATLPEYTRLEPATKRIPLEAIEGWPTMSTPVLGQISVVLKRAKDTIAQSRRDSQKREEANEVLDGSVRLLERHFAATKMPPQANAHHFDLDYLAAHNERVYRELTEARHRKQGLEEQIRIATAELNGEERSLDTLKKNAQQWRGQWKHKGKKQLHPLLQQPGDVAMVSDRPEDLGLRSAAPTDAPLLDMYDPDLVPLLERLRRNLETMQGNQAQVVGVNEAVGDAQVALDDVFFKHASAQQYESL